MKSNFAFLNKLFPILANLGQLAEGYLYSDRNACLIKLGLISENVINLMMKSDGLVAPTLDNHTYRMNQLRKEGLLPEIVNDMLAALRKGRNNAIRNGHDSSVDCIILLEMACKLCDWFMQSYGDCHYEPKPFVLPEDYSWQADKQAQLLALESETKTLVEQVRKQPTFKTVTTAKRSNNGARAAERLKLSEKETRYLIDEKLRNAGWEADSISLCYTSGVRPEKGRNLAIARWPIDLSFAKNSFADYVLCIGEQIVGIIEDRQRGKNFPSVVDYGTVRQIKETGISVTSWDYACRVPFYSVTNGCSYLKPLETNHCIWLLGVGESVNIIQDQQGWFTPSAIMKLLHQEKCVSNRVIQNLPARKSHAVGNFSKQTQH
jgi:type I restriction enzyme R subunit